MASDEHSTTETAPDYEFLFKEVKMLTEQIEALIAKTLPEIPQTPEYELFRKKFSEYQHLRSEYKAVESKENCGEPALEFYDAQNAFTSMYMYGHTTAEGSQDVIELLNKNGMQKIKDIIDDKRTRGVYMKFDRFAFEEFIMKHC